MRKRPEGDISGKRKRAAGEATEKGKRPEELAKGFRDCVGMMGAALSSFNDVCSWVRNERGSDDEWDADTRDFMGPTLTVLEAKLLCIKGSLLSLQATAAELENKVSGLAEVVDAVATAVVDLYDDA